MTNPLFVADLPTLKSLLRMTEVPSDSTDALAILDEGILQARLQFYRRLGTTRVGQLLAITYDANPTTEDEVLRALANTVEVKLVLCHLLRRLPNTWMDASGDIHKRWNEEAPVRELSPTQILDRLAACQNEIEEDMQILAGEEQVGDEELIQTFDGTPDCPTPRVGRTLLGGSRRVTEDPNN